MKKIFSIMAVASALFAGYSTYNTQQNTELTDIALANVEALASGVDATILECPDPYDVRDHQLSHTQRTGTFEVDANGEINIFGKKFKVGGVNVGAKVKKTYEIGHCDMPSPGNCCPNSRVGEIINVN